VHQKVVAAFSRRAECRRLKSSVTNANAENALALQTWRRFFTYKLTKKCCNSEFECVLLAMDVIVFDALRFCPVIRKSIKNFASYHLLSR
jgi:hypothetical protein